MVLYAKSCDDALPFQFVSSGAAPKPWLHWKFLGFAKGGGMQYKEVDWSEF